MDVYIEPDERARANQYIDGLVEAHFGDTAPSPEQEAAYLEELLAEGIYTVPLMDGTEVTVAGGEPGPPPTEGGAEESRSASSKLPLILFLVGFVLLAYLLVGRDLIAGRRASRAVEAGDGEPITISAEGGLDDVQLPAGLDAIVSSGDVRVKTVYPATLEIRPGDDQTTQTYVVVPVSVEVADWPCPQPKDDVAACWVYGTVINYLIGIPADARAEALAQALQSYGGEIILRLSTGTAQRYTVDGVQKVGRQQTEVLSQNRPGITVPLLGGAGSTRTVITGSYIPDIAGLDAGADNNPPTTTGGELLKIYISLGMEASAGPVSVLPRQLGRSGDTLHLVLRVTNRSDRQLQPETWAPQGATSTDDVRSVRAQGTVAPGGVGDITLVGPADIAVWSLTIGDTQIMITGGN